MSAPTINQILGKDKFIKADLLLKAKELKLKGYSTMSVSALTDAIITLSISNSQETNTVSTLEDIAPTQQVKTKKKTIPKVLKNAVWDKYIGQDKGIGNCYCCQSNIDSKHFECGHIISEQDGGDITLDNLRPVCSLCNKSMGTQNMSDFISKLKQDSKIIEIRDIAKVIGFMFDKPIQNRNISIAMRTIKIEYNDDDITKATNYSAINYVSLKDKSIYSRTSKLTDFLTAHKFKNIDDITSYATTSNHMESSHYPFCKVNIEKLVICLQEHGLIIIDTDYKKIIVRTRAEIEEANTIPLCTCISIPHLNMFRSNDNYSNGMFGHATGFGFTNPQSFKCTRCDKVLKSKEYQYKMHMLPLHEKMW